jgi:hypothetical protein
VSGSARSERRRWIIGAVVAGAILTPLLLQQELRSIERGNRMYRSGNAVPAAEIYGALADAGSGSPATFNLGTALLFHQADSAKALLARVAASPDRPTAQRGHYNLGFGQLMASEVAASPDSVLPDLRAAVRSFRQALRLDPHDQDARWNLALAIRRLEALLPPGEDTGEESGSQSDDEVPMNDAQMARSEEAPAESGPEPPDPRPTDDSGERRGPREGAREAWALQDPGPLTTERALELLTTIEDSPEMLLKGILWSHRPDIAWWTGQAYPGGNW